MCYAILRKIKIEEDELRTILFKYFQEELERTGENIGVIHCGNYDPTGGGMRVINYIDITLAKPITKEEWLIRGAEQVRKERL